MMRQVFRAALMAGAATAATWAVKQAMSERRNRRVHADKTDRKAAVQDWENKGGAVKPLGQGAPTQSTPNTSTMNFAG